MNTIRKIVGGPKARTVENGYDLDLTYVTPRMIAMAFPATGLEKIYRNSINSVSSFLNEKHNNRYLIFNLSGRRYQYSKFNNQVKEYDWEDHQAPTLFTIFQICNEMLKFLEENHENVVVVNCNHGKGRTGTIIVSFMLYCNLFDNSKESLLFYARRRFIEEGYGVTQPCQIRYIKYFHSLLLKGQFEIIPYTLKKIQFHGNYKIPKCKIVLSDVSTKQIIIKTNQMENGYVNILKNQLFIGDIFAEIIQKTLFGDRQLIRINFNTLYINGLALRFKVNELSPDSLLKKEKQRIGQDFQIVFFFERYCLCEIDLNTQFEPQQIVCRCQKYILKERKNWLKLNQVFQSYQKPSKESSVKFLYGEYDFFQQQRLSNL